MKTHGKIKSELHHWWPVCVSKHWKNKDGCVHWISPNGEVKVAPIKNLAVLEMGIT